VKCTVTAQKQGQEKRKYLGRDFLPGKTNALHGVKNGLSGELKSEDKECLILNWKE